MGGTRALTCAGFVESPTFEKSKYDLMGETGLTARQIDARLEALVWALARVGEEADAVVTQVPNSDMWVAVIPRGVPPLHVYLRPRPDAPEQCEWLWIERRDGVGL